MTPELTRWNLPDYQLCYYSDSKKEPTVPKAQISMEWEVHRTEKMYSGRGGHCTYFFDVGNYWGGEKTFSGRRGGDTKIFPRLSVDIGYMSNYSFLAYL